MTRAGKTAVRIAIAAGVIAAVAWWVTRRQPAGGPAAAAQGGRGGESRVVPVVTAAVEKKDVPIWAEGLGSVAAFQQVTVRPQVDGRLDKVLFQEGQVVKKGDVLAQIDPRPFLVQLHQAEGALARDKAAVVNGQLNLKRYQDLVDGKLVSQQQVDDQAAAVRQAEGSVQIDLASVENARLMLDYAEIKSPLDGVTGVRQVDAGNLVRASDTTGIVVVTQVDPVSLIFTLPEDLLPRVAAALARGDVPVELRSRDGRELLGKGTLAVLDNQINSSTATLKLKAVAKNPDHRLWPNQFVKVSLLLDTMQNALTVPTVAVQQGAQGMGPFVYVVGADQTVSARPVEIAATVAETSVVGKGVEAGENVVIEGQSQIRPGGKVSPRAQNAKPSERGGKRP